MAIIIHISRQLIECDAHDSQTIQTQSLVYEIGLLDLLVL